MIDVNELATLRAENVRLAALLDAHGIAWRFLEEVGNALAADAPGLSVEALARQMNVAGGPTESPWPKNVGLELPLRRY